MPECTPFVRITLKAHQSAWPVHDAAYVYNPTVSRVPFARVLLTDVHFCVQRDWAATDGIIHRSRALENGGECEFTLDVPVLCAATQIIVRYLENASFELG